MFENIEAVLNSFKTQELPSIEFSTTKNKMLSWTLTGISLPVIIPCMVMVLSLFFIIAIVVDLCNAVIDLCEKKKVEE